MAKPKEPNSEQRQIIKEIIELVLSFRREIPAGRTAWPLSIRERVQNLYINGMSYRQICILTGLPYDTVVSWPGRKGAIGFHALQVTHKSNVATVTVAASQSSCLIFNYRGMRVEGLIFSQIESLILKLGDAK